MEILNYKNAAINTAIELFLFAIIKIVLNYKCLYI